jgi:hypothetical protein
MLRANLIPNVKKKKSFRLTSSDKISILIFFIILILALATYTYALYGRKMTIGKLNALTLEIAGFGTEKSLFLENKAFSEKTYDFEKYIDTALKAQLNENLVLDSVSKSMLPDTFLTSIVLDIKGESLIMDFRSPSFSSLTKLFNNLLANKSLKNVRIANYSLSLKTAAKISSQDTAEGGATMKISAVWVLEDKKVEVKPDEG